MQQRSERSFEGSGRDKRPCLDPSAQAIVPAGASAQFAAMDTNGSSSEVGARLLVISDLI